MQYSPVFVIAALIFGLVGVTLYRPPLVAETGVVCGTSPDRCR
jgi:hypothetical protein